MSLLETHAKLTGSARRDWRRFVPLAAAALLLLSLAFPYWQVTLFAPQYPGGLRAYVYLTHVGGDAQEISSLNHYIGMAGLDRAAPLERRLAIPLILLSVAALLVSAYVRPVGGRWLRFLFRLPAALLPVGVVADLTYWLWWIGHVIDPTAPIRIEPFMPTIIGRGTVMQFATFATFGVGFFLALAAAGLAIEDFFRRRAAA
jgi:hypothetical protein